MDRDEHRDGPENVNRDEREHEQEGERQREDERHASKPASKPADEPVDKRNRDWRSNPPRTTTGRMTAPKFGSATSGGGEFEPGPESD